MEEKRYIPVDPQRVPRQSEADKRALIVQMETQIDHKLAALKSEMKKARPNQKKIEKLKETIKNMRATVLAQKKFLKEVESNFAKTLDFSHQK